jgi:ABC-2 type transport system permease protein
MFSFTIFKQTLRQNWKLWAIFTAVSSVLSAVIISVYDPRMMQRMMDTLSSVPGLGDMISEQMGGANSLLGMLGATFYSLQGVILPLIFIIMTANSLIASQVDRGSMAYTLSTPIKRTKVVCTQALYMIVGVLCMFLVITAVGLCVVQIRHQGLWGSEFTPDVVAAADVLNLDEEYLENNLNLILADPEAVKAGANARGIEQDVYTMYLSLKIAGQTDTPPSEQTSADSEQAKIMQEKLMDGLNAAAAELNMDVADLATDMIAIKEHPQAMDAAVSASGLPETVFIGAINQQLANDELGFDLGISFSIKDYLYLNLGAFLLMFAISGISFMFSCVFNLTKNSLALGAGIPIAFFIFEIMSEASSDLEFFKYFSLNTLFDASAIADGGEFFPQFVVLAIVGAVLFLTGIIVFKEKDLPL